MTGTLREILIQFAEMWGISQSEMLKRGNQLPGEPASLSARLKRVHTTREPDEAERAQVPSTARHVVVVESSSPTAKSLILFATPYKHNHEEKLTPQCVFLEKGTVVAHGDVGQSEADVIALSEKMEREEASDLHEPPEGDLDF